MNNRFAKSAAASERAVDDPEYADNLRRATLASGVGSALEYYDFAIYGLASALIFGKLFFPALGASTALIASFATFGVGFLARPLGGLFFGSMGDKLGRKSVLMITITLMGGASTLVGVLPTGKQLGIWAPSCWFSCVCARASAPAPSRPVRRSSWPSTHPSSVAVSSPPCLSSESRPARSWQPASSP